MFYQFRGSINRFRTSQNDIPRTRILSNHSKHEKHESSLLGVHKSLFACAKVNPQIHAVTARKTWKVSCKKIVYDGVHTSQCQHCICFGIRDPFTPWHFSNVQMYEWQMATAFFIHRNNIILFLWIKWCYVWRGSN